ncbi:MAG: hypothetical protein B6244_00465 [Candidatus Cloacimonetes bacterium 4572_55]|nr:MAG: hypothetical protein B6244_00465 [Candidatus Cloacimonetes bacterium 4572_55]
MYIGIDLGGTGIKHGLVSNQGISDRVGNLSTRSHLGRDAVIDRLCDCIDRLLNRARKLSVPIKGIGLGIAGPLNFETGIVYEAPNLPGWKDVPIRDIIGDRFDLPTVVENDANAAVYGEWWRGCGQGSSRMIGLTLGTGVGGGIIINSKLYRGADGVAGEIGHICLDPKGPKCVCGSAGCLEAFVSATAWVRRAKEEISSGKKTLIIQLAENDMDRITSVMVHQAQKQGDPVAARLFEEAAYYLGVGIASLVNLFNPEIVSLSGGMANAGEDLFGPLRRVVAERAFERPAKRVKILQSKLIDRAGVIGAAGLARRSQLAE